MTKREVKQTPFGEANFPFIQEPDKEYNPEGIYQIKVIFKKDEVQQDIKIINDVISKVVADEHLKQPGRTEQFKRAPLPYKELDDGRVQITFKSKFKPQIVDHNLETIPDDKKIWSGSIVRISYEPSGYSMSSLGLGCKLYLKAVQIKKLVEGTAGDTGFSKVTPEQPETANLVEFTNDKQPIQL